MDRIVDLQHEDMSDDYVDMLLGTMNTMVPLDGSPECEDLWYALCGA